MSREQVDKASKALGLKLSEVEIAMLMTPPYRGGLGETVPTDALLYRFYEVIQVYGPAMKALIEEEFGDGIMSAIDFSMDISRQEDPKGDRVVVTYNGKFLPYKSF
jgi:cyanate lyase